MEKPSVLVVDDNEATCTLITALLQTDFAVEVVHDGQEAIARLKSRRYATILLDLLMPIVDGYGVLDFLGETNPELLRKTIVVTASLSPRQLDRVKKYEVCGIIAKPFEVDTLFAAVRQCADDTGPLFMRGPLLSSGMILLLAEVGRALKL
ncbi:MAG TPA: response regulator [Thermoanaerobaculia bacterium]|nr:response regulator [Thermoanaerobaculia bacterium]